MELPIDYYNSINEALKNLRRKELFESKKEQLVKIKTDLFDHYNVESIYVINDFFNKEIFQLEKMPIYMEMTQPDFESFVDSGKISSLQENFDVFVKVKETTFHYDNYWKTETFKLNKKVLL